MTNIPTVINDDFINNEFKDFNVARFKERIPAFDGLIHPQRCVLFEMIKNGSKKRNIETCVSSARTISSFLHGAGSLEDVAKNMANRPYSLFKGYGTFPTKTNKGSASRYISMKLTKSTTSLFFNKVDNIDLQEKQVMNGVQVEPHYYKPTIPLGLIHGNIQIGSGFSVTMFPRDLKDVLHNMVNCLEHKPMFRMPFKIPHFTGTVVKTHGEKSKVRQWLVSGKVHFDKNNHLIIDEIPFNVGLKLIIENIVKLKEMGEIVDFYNDSKKNTIHIEVILSNQMITELRTMDKTERHDFIFNKFKLHRKVSETLVMIHGKTDDNHELKDLKLYNFKDELSYLSEWIEIRKEQLRERIDYLLLKKEQELFKAQSIALVVFLQTVDYINLTKQHDYEAQNKLVDTVVDTNFNMVNAKDREEQSKEIDEIGCYDLPYLYGYKGLTHSYDKHAKDSAYRANTANDYDYLFSLQIKQLTKKEVDKQIKIVKRLKEELFELTQTTPKIEIMKEIDAVYKGLIDE